MSVIIVPLDDTVVRALLCYKDKIIAAEEDRIKRMGKKAGKSRKVGVDDAEESFENELEKVNDMLQNGIHGIQRQPQSTQRASVSRKHKTTTRSKTTAIDDNEPYQNPFTGEIIYPDREVYFGGPSRSSPQKQSGISKVGRRSKDNKSLEKRGSQNSKTTASQHRVERQSSSVRESKGKALSRKPVYEDEVESVQLPRPARRTEREVVNTPLPAYDEIDIDTISRNTPDGASTRTRSSNGNSVPENSFESFDFEIPETKESVSSSDVWVDGSQQANESKQPTVERTEGQHPTCGDIPNTNEAISTAGSASLWADIALAKKLQEQEDALAKDFFLAQKLSTTLHDTTNSREPILTDQSIPIRQYASYANTERTTSTASDDDPWRKFLSPKSTQKESCRTGAQKTSKSVSTKASSSTSSHRRRRIVDPEPPSYETIFAKRQSKPSSHQTTVKSDRELAIKLQLQYAAEQKDRQLAMKLQAEEDSLSKDPGRVHKTTKQLENKEKTQLEKQLQLVAELQLKYDREDKRDRDRFQQVQKENQRYLRDHITLEKRTATRRTPTTNVPTTRSLGDSKKVGDRRGKDERIIPTQILEEVRRQEEYARGLQALYNEEARAKEQEHQRLKDAEKKRIAAEALKRKNAEELKRKLEKKERDRIKAEREKLLYTQCAVCMEKIEKSKAFTPCSHSYCQGCLSEAFNVAVKSKVPFKCCKEIPLATVSHLIPKRTRDAYAELLVELSTPNPVYCSQRSCAAFISPKRISGDVATCLKCRRRTCRHCRNATHKGVCKEDVETQKVLEEGKRKGWKQCPGCSHLVERIDGCLHMTCSRCSRQFCYKCGRNYDTCNSAPCPR